MTYIDPRDDSTRDVATEPLPKLVALLKFLKKGYAKWEHANSPNGTTRLCRAIRARLFRERQAPKGYLRHLLNALDPPACRCGRAGTRISGGSTFCERCGPPSFAIYGKRRQLAAQDEKHAMISRDNRKFDAHQLETLSLRALRNWHGRA